MRAWQVAERGHQSTALRLVEVSRPEPGPGELLIRVRAAVVNFADILLCQGIYQDRPPTPFTPGLEAAGVIGNFRHRPLDTERTSPDFADVIEAIERTATWPLDGYLITCPYYTRPSQEGLLRHFTALANAATR